MLTAFFYSIWAVSDGSSVWAAYSDLTGVRDSELCLEEDSEFSAWSVRKLFPLRSIFQIKTQPLLICFDCTLFLVPQAARCTRVCPKSHDPRVVHPALIWDNICNVAARRVDNFSGKVNWGDQWNECEVSPTSRDLIVIKSLGQGRKQANFVSAQGLKNCAFLDIVQDSPYKLYLFAKL